MPSLIGALSCANSTIQNFTGYSFSLSHIPQNINKIALPVILATGMYVAVNAENFPENYSIECCCDYKECITSCAEDSFQYEDYFGALGKCAQVCVECFFKAS